ncbi:MAG: hypothetical protein ACYTGI_20130 [Planctomycetota bacterium]
MVALSLVAVILLAACSGGSTIQVLTLTVQEPALAQTVRPGEAVGVQSLVSLPATVSIYADADGDLATTDDQTAIAVDRADPGSTPQSLNWDTSGMDTGNYTIVVVATVNGLTISEIAAGSVTVNVAPSAQVNALPIDGEIVNWGRRTTVAYADDDPDDNALTSVFLDGDGDVSTTDDQFEIAVDRTDGNGGTQAVEWDTTDVAPGTYYYIVQTSDGLGSPVTAVSTDTISIVEPAAVVLSEMVLIPGNTQGWVWERQNDYADDLGFGYLSAGGYMEIDPNDPDPWAFNQEVPAVEDTVLRQTGDVSHYLEVGALPTKVVVYGQVWDYDNDYYAFYLEAGTRVTWWYTGALPVTSELIAHPDLNPNGVVQLVSPNSYRVETTGFYFYKQERRGYSPADGDYDVPPGFPHFQCFRLDLTFDQWVTRDEIVAVLGESDTTQETGGTIYDVWYIDGTANTAPTIEVLWRHNDLRVFYQNGTGYVSTQYSGPRWMRASWFVDFAPLLAPGPGELTPADEAWLVDHPLALGDNG